MRRWQSSIPFQDTIRAPFPLFPKGPVRAWGSGLLRLSLSRFSLVFNDLSAKMDFDDLRDAGFPEEELDGRLIFTEAFNLNLAGRLDNIVAQANFVKDRCLLGLGIWHTVSDGYGAYNLAQRWAENCKILQSSSHRDMHVEVIPESTNREILAMVWPTEDFQVTSAKESGRSWRFLGLNPMNENSDPKIPAKLTPPQTSQPKATPVMRTCIFYVSASSFEELKRAATPGESDIRITANDAVNTLWWRSVMSALYPPDRTSTTSDQETQFNMALGGRVYPPQTPLYLPREHGHLRLRNALPLNLNLPNHPAQLPSP